MPWKECSVMDERLRFVARLLDGEAMTEVCREFGISRKTGYKIFDRYKEHGLDGPDRPLAAAGALRQPAAGTDREPDCRLQAEQAALGRPQDPRTPGPPARRRCPGAGQKHHPCGPRPPWPGQAQRQPRQRARRHAAVRGRHAQRSVVRRLQGRVQARQRPLLLSADRHRPCLALPAAVRSAWNRPAKTPLLPPSNGCSRDRGLPPAIRSDNGVPFASPNALFNLSKLSVWWLRLGIAIERIKPGHPQQNGRHERMHLTLKKEATRPPGMNSLQQQARFDAFLNEFNTERPHEALAMKCPAELYGPSPRPYDGLPDLAYPLHDRDVLVTACGRICLHRKKINISTVLAGQKPRHQGSRRRHLARQLHALRSRLYRLGAENPAASRQPVRPEVVTHVLGTFCYPCLRAGQKQDGGEEGIRTLDTALDRITV